MKKVYMAIILLSVLVLSMIYVLSRVDTFHKPSKETNNTRLLITKIPMISSTPIPTSSLKEIQNTFKEDINTYITSPQTNPKMLFSTLISKGQIRSIKFINSETVTLVTQDIKGNKIESYSTFPINFFVVYKRVDANLIKFDIKKLSINDTVTVREFEEVAKNNQDPKSLLGYFEIIVE